MSSMRSSQDVEAGGGRGHGGGRIYYGYKHHLRRMGFRPQSMDRHRRVYLEIGHEATPKTKPTAEGHTHDWTVFVRGPDNREIQHFVEKVVFHLHESYPDPKRVVEDWPFEVSESGNASFELPIEVHFKNVEEPKICFDYDLYLRPDEPVSNTQLKTLTFQNPNNDFKEKLVKAGDGVDESHGSADKSDFPLDDKSTA